MPALRKWTAAPVQQQAPMPAQQLACDLQRAQAGLECCRCSLPLERLHQPASQLVLLWCSGSAACCSAYACRLPQICSRQELASGLPENVCSRPELQCSACPAGPHSLLCGNSILEFQDSRRHLWGLSLLHSSACSAAPSGHAEGRSRQILCCGLQQCISRAASSSCPSIRLECWSNPPTGPLQGPQCCLAAAAGFRCCRRPAPGQQALSAHPVVAACFSPAGCVFGLHAATGLACFGPAGH